MLLRHFVWPPVSKALSSFQAPIESSMISVNDVVFCDRVPNLNRSEIENSTTFRPLDLEALLAPMTVSEFLAGYWLRSHYYGAGWPGKFADLLPWQELNRILEHHKLESPRLRLIKSGKWIDPQTYTDYRYRDGQARPRIAVKEFTDHLREGATLILNDVDGLCKPLNQLAESLERRFGVPVGINAYAGWRTCHGFDLHRDNHEVFVLQLSGSKRWLLYGTERSFGEENRLPPEPIWDQVISDGALLYIPRGCWHVAIPLAEHCMHLTVSVSNPSAADILVWLADELRVAELGQTSVSPFADTAERLKFVDHLKDVVLRALEPELLVRYFESSDSNRRTVAHLSLPWSATLAGLQFDNNALVRLTGRRVLSLHNDPQHGAVEFTIAGKIWRFPLVLRPVVEALSDGRVMPVEQLVAIGRAGVGEQMAREFVATLVKEGIVFIVSVEHQT
jgi:ribosomal protein L16 Arg81 hydroxylase